MARLICLMDTVLITFYTTHYNILYILFPCYAYIQISINKYAINCIYIYKLINLYYPYQFIIVILLMRLL